MLTENVDGFLLVMVGAGSVLLLVSSRLGPPSPSADKVAGLVFGAIAALIILTGLTLRRGEDSFQGLHLIETATAFASVACLFCALLAVEERTPHVLRLLFAGGGAVGVAAASPLWSHAMPQLTGGTVVLFSAMAAGIAIWRLHRPSGVSNAALIAAPFAAISLGLGADLLQGTSTAGSTLGIALAFLAASVGIAARHSLANTRDEMDALRIDRAASRKRARVMLSIGREMQSAVDGIAGISGLMKTGHQTIQPAHYRGFISNIHQNSRVLRSRLIDLLDLAAMDKGGIEVEDDIVDVAELLYAVRETLAATASANGVRIEISVEEGAPAFVRGDDMRIFRMLAKIGDGALAAMRTGGFIAITAERSGAGGLALSLIGHGRGMAANRTPESVEIDLALASAIAAAHGGQLSIDMTPGQPMIFCASLPPGRNGPVGAADALFAAIAPAQSTDQSRSAA